ncbi:MAG: acid phosphatase type 7 [Pseudonocardiales bacterium]|nr:acid phosphatase type 7 [Pseudonocardiales bacterium]
MVCSRRRVIRLLVGAICAVSGIGLLPPASAAGAAGNYSSHLTRAPYLTDLVALSVNVNWATDASGAGSLQWGAVAGGNCALTNTLTNPTFRGVTVGSVSETQWTAALSLPSKGSYCYRPMLGAADLLGANTSPQFRTQVQAGDTTPYSFAVFGDWGQTYATGNPDQQNVMSQLAKSGARFAVTAGDNGYPNGSQINYGDLQQSGADISAIFGPNFWTVPGSSIPLFTAAGNHGLSNSAHTDISTWTQDTAVLTSGGTYTNTTYCCVNGTFSANYGSEWYAFDAGPARFYVLDSAWGDTNTGTANVYANDAAAHFTAGTPEYDWLLNDLKTHPASLKFAFSHYPVYSDSASQPSDSSLQGAGKLEGLLGQYGVDIWFNGHSHIYERNTPSAAGMPVTYVTGGGGAALGSIGPCHSYDAYGIGSSSACGAAPKPTSRAQVFHFLKVDVNGATVTVTPTDENGNQFDVKTYDFGNANVPDTVIDSGPKALTNATNATFEFHSTLSNPTFACSLDNAPATACGSPKGYSGLADGAHTFSVTSTSGGSTDPSPAVFKWTVKTTAPPAPTGLTATVVSATAIKLSWNAGSGVASYDIIRNGSSVGTAAGTATGYVDNRVSPASTYHYVIDARDGAGNVSPPSNQTPDVTTPNGTSGPSLVQSGGSSTKTVTLASPSTSGDLLVLSAGVYTGASQPITAISDGTNAWAKINAVSVAGQYSDGELWYAPDAASVSSVTVTTAASTVALRVQEFSGVVATNPLDGSTGASATSTSATSGSVTPSAANDLAVGFIAGHGKTQDISVTSPGCTVDPQQSTATPSPVSVVTGSQALTSNAALSFSGTFPSAMYWAASIALFKASGAPPPLNDFAVSANPGSMTATQGGTSGSSTITAPLVSGSAQTVTLSAAGVPSGATASFSPPTISSNGTSSSALTITTASTTPTGSYSLTVTGTGSVTRSTTVSLTVNAAAQDDFSISASPGAVTATQGGASGSSTITAALTTGSAAQQVTLSATGSPTAATAAFSPGSVISSAGGTASLTITTTNDTPAGTYPITVTGTGTTVHTTTVSLIVNANSFTLAANPASVTSTQGGTSESSAISTALTTGSTAQQVTVSTTGLPAGAAASVNPTSITSDAGSSSMTISTASSTPGGTYQITVTGTGASSWITSITVTLTVTAPVIDDFAMSAAPTSVTATQGGTSGSSTITTTLTSGNPQQVTLSASGLPAGAAAVFSPAAVTSAGGSSTMTITTTASTPPGTFPLTVTGTGSTTHGVAVTFTVITGATPLLVQAAAGTATSTVTSLSATFGAPTASGHLLVLSASVYAGATNHLTAVTDSAGNTWTRVGSYFASGHFSDGELWYAANANPTTTITVNIASAASIAIEVLEFSGIAASNPLDTSVGTSNTGTAPDSGKLTPAASTELVVGFIAGHGNAQALSVTTPGYTVQAQATTTGTAATVRTAYQVLSSASPIGIAGSFATSMYWAAGVAAFRAG